MSECPLPDDSAQWPEDPNELLGVSFGVTPRDLRRAYNRLIRIYKPEQFPEQFRRIREAYEYLLRIAEMFAQPAETVDSPSTEGSSETAAPKEQSLDNDGTEWVAGTPQPLEEMPEEIPPVRVRQPQEGLDGLWQTAIAGSPAAAYERLVQLTQQYAGRVENYQRLYWLLTLWPDLDARRVPVDWLVQGLLATGLAGPLRELYREEVADKPAEALSERYERLLDTPVAASLLADLIEWRFQAAIRLQRWDVLNADLARLGQRFGFGEEQLWLRLLFLLADGAAWATDAEGECLLASCRAEIIRHEHMASSMSYSFDRLDLLLAAMAGWRKLSRGDGVFATIWRLMNTPFDAPFSIWLRRRVSAVLLQLIRNSWSRPLAEIREPLMKTLAAMAGSPQQWLRHLDEIHKRAPAALALFGELLDRFEEGREIEEWSDPETQNELALAFLAHLNVANYKGERYRLLMFCLREHIAPEEMVKAASGAWEQALLADWPLRYVCRACRLFWA